MQILEIMPSTATNVAMAGVGAFAAAGALSGAFVAPAGQVQHSEPQMQRTNLRAAGYGSSQAAGVGAMAGLGAVAGLAAAGVAGKRASKGRTSMQAVGVGINGFGRIGRQVARIAMKDPETGLKLLNASYDADYLASGLSRRLRGSRLSALPSTRVLTLSLTRLKGIVVLLLLLKGSPTTMASQAQQLLKTSSPRADCKQSSGCFAPKNSPKLLLESTLPRIPGFCLSLFSKQGFGSTVSAFMPWPKPPTPNSVFGPSAGSAADRLKGFPTCVRKMVPQPQAPPRHRTLLLVAWIRFSYLSGIRCGRNFFHFILSRRLNDLPPPTHIFP